MAAVEHAYDAALYPEPADAKNAVFTMRYIGNIYGGRSPETLLKALVELKRRSTVPFKLELVLSYPRRLQALLREHGLEGLVEARPAVDYLESLRLMRTADLLLTFENPLPSPPFGKNLFLPSKLADYIGSGKPILALAGPGATRRVAESCGGAAVDPGDAEGLALRLAELADRWRKGETYRPAAAAAGYAAPAQARRFMELVR
jgi:glycosyltransferase involved in cell wall biosynthesis